MLRLLLAALAALILTVSVAIAGPSSSVAAPAASASTKHRCKHKAKKRNAKPHRRGKKRCRKKANGTGSAEKPGNGDGPGTSGTPGRLLATERELSATQLQLQLSRASLPAGNSIVEQYNAGSDPHNLILERQGAVAFTFPTLDPGLNQRQTLNLARGTWTLYCSILDHRELGMQATLTVD